MKLDRLPLIVVFGATLSGCSLAPDYERPALPVSNQWPSGEAYAFPDAGEVAAADTGWREFFLDPALQRLIEVALENNRDLRTAALNVEAFRARYRISRSDLFPTIGADGTFARQRVPRDLSPTGEGDTSWQHGVNIGVSAYELDVFGRVRSLSDAALESYLATEEVRRSVHIGLVGDVAIAYLTWRTDQQLLDLSISTRDSYQESLQLISSRAEAGVASDLEVRQVRTLLEQAETQVARYTRQVAEDINALQFLLGSSLPEDMPVGLPLEGTLLAHVPAGLPADVLQRRPDIRAAEHQLRAAYADIGAARAAFFPSIRLTATGGTASDELDNLFGDGSGTWSFIPQINIPIFTAGRLRANLDYAKISKDMHIAQYEKAIQAAFKEVADGLAARGTYNKQLEAQRRLVDETRAYFNLANQRYEDGVDPYLTVLDARRNLFAAQQQLQGDRLAQLSREIQLYKALGGGWTAERAAR